MVGDPYQSFVGKTVMETVEVSCEGCETIRHFDTVRNHESRGDNGLRPRWKYIRNLPSMWFTERIYLVRLHRRNHRWLTRR